jgi:phospholipid transport system substrate-binding protein
MKQTPLRQTFALLAAVLIALAAPAAHADDEAPDVLIRRLLTDVQESIKNDKSVGAGDSTKLVALIDSRIMPNVNFQRMTAAVVGPAWRQASAEQQKRIQQEFRILLERAYANALTKLNDKTIEMKPLKLAAEDKEVLVRVEIKGSGETVQLDYRLEKTPGQGAGWRIFNLKVLGAWLVETYRAQFAQEISAKGIEGLISTLAERNKANSKKA